MTEERAPQSAEKYIVRFPEGMRNLIADAAKKNNRSMNAEIVARLDQTFSILGAGGALGALALRLAEAEMDLRATRVEMMDRLLDLSFACDCVLHAVEFNNEKGYEQPILDDELIDIRLMHDAAEVLLEEQHEEHFRKAVEELEAAQARVEALQAKPRKLRVRQAKSSVVGESQPREIVMNMADLDVQVSPSGGLTSDPRKTEQNRQKREAAEREVAQNTAASQEPAQPRQRRITIRKRSQ